MLLGGNMVSLYYNMIKCTFGSYAPLFLDDKIMIKMRECINGEVSLDPGESLRKATPDVA